MSAGAGDSPTSPVFRPMAKRRMVFGCGGAEWARVLAVLAAGALLFFLTGQIMVEGSVQTTVAERQEYAAYLRECADALAAEEAGRALDEEQRALAQAAREAGVAADATDAELYSLAPKRQAGQVKALGDAPRLALLVALPAVAAYAWNMEISHGASMRSEAARVLRWRRSQRAFESRPKEYLKWE